MSEFFILHKKTGIYIYIHTENKETEESTGYFSVRLKSWSFRFRAKQSLTSWGIDGETVETVSDFIFGGSKITAMVTTAMKLKDTYSLEGKLWPTWIAY